MYHGGDMILHVRRSKLNAAHTCTTLRQEPLGHYQFHKKQKRSYAIHFELGAANTKNRPISEPIRLQDLEDSARCTVALCNNRRTL